MDALLIDGGHLCDSLGSPVMVGGERELLQRAAIRLAVRRGSLPHDPAFGSTLHRLDADGPAGARDARALADARLALAPLPQFEVRAPGTAGEVPIPAGTACAAPDGRVYLTTDAGSIPAGETSATLAARAALAGRGGNAAAGSVTLPRRLAAGVAAVENGAPFAGGTDAEGDDSLRRRLLAAWARPANGVNGESYRAAAEAWPGIGSAAVCAGERPGSLTVYAAADGAPAVPEAVLAGLSEALGGMRAPCDTVTVESAEAVAAGVSIEIEAPAECFSEVREALLGRVRETLDRMPVGAGLPVARLCALAMDREEVTNCRVLLPAADLAAGPAQVLRAGELSVTRMGG